MWSFRSKLIASAVLTSAVMSLPAHNAVAGGEFELEPPAETRQLKINGHVALLSDYRFRGVSLSDEFPVLQGSFVLSYGGFYAGAWSSPIQFQDFDTGFPEDEDNAEIDIFAGYNFKLPSDITWTVQVAAITFPGVDDTGFFRATTGLSKNFGLFTAGIKVDYEPEQGFRGLADEDNIYISSSFNAKIAEVRGKAINLDLGLAYEDGAFADEKIDWLVGLSTEILGVVWKAEYIDTNIDSDNTDATVVFSVRKNF